MSTIEDLLNQLPTPEPPAKTPARKDAPGYSEWDGETGFVNGPQTTQRDANIDDIIRGMGFDPETVEAVGPVRISQWDGFVEGEVTKLYSHRVRIQARQTASFDMPDLDRLIQRHRVTNPKPGTGPRTAVIVAFADPQIGKRANRGGTAETIERIGETYDLLAAYTKRVKPSMAVWADLGDVIEGFESGAGPMSQATLNDLSLMRQIEVATAIEHAGIALLAKLAPKVVVAGVGSNHCRWRAGKENLGTPADDWGLHILRNLRARYADTKGFEHVSFVLPQEFEEHALIDVLGTQVGVAHGHRAGKAEKIGDWWKGQTHGGSSLAYADVLLAGHFHNFQTYPSGRSLAGREKRVYVAPTLDPGSPWFSTGMAGADSDPGLLVLTVTEGVGVTDHKVLRPGGWQ